MRPPTVELVVHLEPADEGVVWWAESPAFPGFSAAADTLHDLRERALAAVRERLGRGVRVVERLATWPST